MFTNKKLSLTPVSLVSSVILQLPLGERGPVMTLAYRARTVISEREDRKKELEHLRGALKCNGHPNWIL